MHQGPGPAVENSAAWKIPPEQRQRIQVVLLRESGMTQLTRQRLGLIKALPVLAGEARVG
jgi:hypothetical protein